MAENQVIEITEGDIKAAGKRLDEKRTPRQIQIEEVSSKAIQITVENLKQASTLAEFLLWHRATLYSLPEYIGWMWEEGQPPSADNIANEYRDQRYTDKFEHEAEIVRELEEKLRKLEDKPDQVKVALKRVRNKSGDSWTYRCLAVFPKDTKIYDEILDRYGIAQLSADTGTVIYFEPENACVQHACDDLYKANKETGGLLYLPNKGLTDAMFELKANSKNIYEYQLEKSDQGSIKQRAGEYLLVGILGGYSNERRRTRVSDFTPQKSS